MPKCKMTQVRATSLYVQNDNGDRVALFKPQGASLNTFTVPNSPGLQILVEDPLRRVYVDSEQLTYSFSEDPPVLTTTDITELAVEPAFSAVLDHGMSQLLPGPIEKRIKYCGCTLYAIDSTRSFHILTEDDKLVDKRPLSMMLIHINKIPGVDGTFVLSKHRMCVLIANAYEDKTDEVLSQVKEGIRYGFGQWDEWRLLIR